MSARIWSMDWRDHAIPEPNSGCWLWEGQIDGRRYPKQIIGGRHIQVHRRVWEEANGPIPKGMLVRHSCDNTLCVNPDHLLIGTNADNNWDKVRRGRHHNSRKTHCPRGHEYTPENTYIQLQWNTASRQCKQCTLISNARRRQLLKAEAVIP